MLITDAVNLTIAKEIDCLKKEGYTIVYSIDEAPGTSPYFPNKEYAVRLYSGYCPESSYTKTNWFKEDDPQLLTKLIKFWNEFIVFIKEKKSKMIKMNNDNLLYQVLFNNEILEVPNIDEASKLAKQKIAEGASEVSIKITKKPNVFPKIFEQVIHEVELIDGGSLDYTEITTKNNKNARLTFRIQIFDGSVKHEDFKQMVGKKVKVTIEVVEEP